MTGPEGSGQWDPDIDAYVNRPASGEWPDDEWTDPAGPGGPGAVARWHGTTSSGAGWTTGLAGPVVLLGTGVLVAAWLRGGRR